MLNKAQLVYKAILITGAAGIIGANLMVELIKTQCPIVVIGIDNLNNAG